MNIFSKINQNLLERYSSIWNTKIVWILLIAFFVHLLFFVIGFVSHSDPTSLQDYNVLQHYFENGFILVNIVISILIIVGWLVYMFKNNSFKNFYPTSTFSLFGQFVQYFIIIFASTTFYYSYMFGFQTYINTKYDDAKMIKQIELINKVYPFLTFEPIRYTITEKQYPEAYANLYCETDPNKIDYSKKYYTYYNSNYQFNELYSVTVTERDSLKRFIYPEREALTGIPLAYLNEQEIKCIFYFKKNVADVSDYIKNANMNFGNFSNVLYTFGTGKRIDYSYDRYYDGIPELEATVDAKIGLQQNKQVVELLKRENKQEFQTLFNEFLAISEKYQIDHNLTVENWLPLVFNPPTFDVEKFILKSKPQKDGYIDYPTYYDNENAVDEVEAETTVYGDETKGEGNTFEDPLITKRREFIKNGTTEYYYEIENLKSFLENVDEVKNSNFVSESIVFFLWMAFVFSTLIFSFRVTNLRALLFSIISAGIIGLVSSLFLVGIAFVVYDTMAFVAFYYGIALGTFILLMPVIAPNFGSKLFRSILINISINGFVFYLFLILATIIANEEAACRKINFNSVGNKTCNSVVESLGIEFWSIALLSCSFLFILLYSNVIKKWKASPE